jgi:hypothetical protein
MGQSAEMNVDVRNRECIWCHSDGLRRVTRKGFLRRHALPVFGFYPWECMSCRRVSFLRDDGHHTNMNGV